MCLLGFRMVQCDQCHWLNSNIIPASAICVLILRAYVCRLVRILAASLSLWDIIILGCHSDLQDSVWWPRGSTFWEGGYGDLWCQSHCRDLRKCPQFQLQSCKLQCRCWWSLWGGTSFWWCWLGRRRSHQWPQGQNLSKHRLCTSLVSYYSLNWNSEWCLLPESDVCFSSTWIQSGIRRTWYHVGHL